MTHERLALGLDGGGSKCDAVLIDEQGNVLGWGRGGSTASLYIGIPAARQSLAEAVRTSLGEYRPDDLWIAGMIACEFEAAGVEIARTHFVHANEMTMGLAMAMETHGLLVLSGTGSFVYGRTESGESVHLDSLGPVLGDYGSGYQIGLMGIRAAAASSWSPRRNTVLEQMVPAELGVSTPRDIYNLVYHEHIGRSRIASAARAVVRAAEQGDRIAKQIIIQSADDISEVLADVICRLGMQSADCALAASGGIAQGSDIYWNRICERALEMAPSLRPVCPKIRPCAGAALLALREMGVDWTPELLARIEETQQAYTSMRQPDA